MSLFQKYKDLVNQDKAEIERLEKTIDKSEDQGIDCNAEYKKLEVTRKNLESLENFINRIMEWE